MAVAAAAAAATAASVAKVGATAVKAAVKAAASAAKDAVGDRNAPIGQRLKTRHALRARSLRAAMTAVDAGLAKTADPKVAANHVGSRVAKAGVARARSAKPGWPHPS